MSESSSSRTGAKDRFLKQDTALYRLLQFPLRLSTWFFSLDSSQDFNIVGWDSAYLGNDPID